MITFFGIKMKKPFFSTKYQGYRIHRLYNLPGYVEPFDEYKQQFREEHYAFWGLIKYRSKVLFEEVIPNYVIFHEWFLPWGADWKSACPDEIKHLFKWRHGAYQKNTQEIEAQST